MQVDCEGMIACAAAVAAAAAACSALAAAAGYVRVECLAAVPSSGAWLVLQGNKASTFGEWHEAWTARLRLPTMLRLLLLLLPLPIHQMANANGAAACGTEEEDL